MEVRGGIAGKWYNKWITFIYEALSCLDKSTYKWLHLPNAGGYYDQDEFLMGVWELIKLGYIKAMKDPQIVKQLRIDANKSALKLQEE